MHRRTRRVAGGIAVAALLGATACVSLPLPGRDAGDSGETVGWKLVVEKREPNLLVAVDRTYCEVTRERFEETEEGERVFCHWRNRDSPGRHRSSSAAPSARDRTGHPATDAAHDETEGVR